MQILTFKPNHQIGKDKGKEAPKEGEAKAVGREPADEVFKTGEVPREDRVPREDGVLKADEEAKLGLEVNSPEGCFCESLTPMATVNFRKTKSITQPPH